MSAGERRAFRLCPGRHVVPRRGGRTAVGRCRPRWCACSTTERVRPVGGEQLRSRSNVRVVAASNRDAVATSRRRRAACAPTCTTGLQVVEIALPPLRLAQGRHRRPGRALHRHAGTATRRRADRGHHGRRAELPDPVRLARQRARAAQPDRALADPGRAQRVSALYQGLAPRVPPMARPETALPTDLHTLEKMHISAVLESVDGDKTRAASLLGISRRTLERRVAEWSESPPLRLRSPQGGTASGLAKPDPRRLLGGAVVRARLTSHPRQAAGDGAAAAGGGAAAHQHRAAVVGRLGLRPPARHQDSLPTSRWPVATSTACSARSVRARWPLPSRTRWHACAAATAGACAEFLIRHKQRERLDFLELRDPDGRVIASSEGAASAPHPAAAPGRHAQTTAAAVSSCLRQSSWRASHLRWPRACRCRWWPRATPCRPSARRRTARWSRCRACQVRDDAGRVLGTVAGRRAAQPQPGLHRPHQRDRLPEPARCPSAAAARPRCSSTTCASRPTCACSPTATTRTVVGRSAPASRAACASWCSAPAPPGSAAPSSSATGTSRATSRWPTAPASAWACSTWATSSGRSPGSSTACWAPSAPCCWW